MTTKDVLRMKLLTGKKCDYVVMEVMGWPIHCLDPAIVKAWMEGYESDAKYLCATHREVVNAAHLEEINKPA